jgi:hypothetical protein
MTDRTSTPPDSDATPTPTILVVDEPANRELVSMFLEDEGYIMRQARDGLEALGDMGGLTTNCTTGWVARAEAQPAP